MLPETILRTKFFLPPTHRHLITRPRILNKLDDTFRPETRLTLLCAPAGFGKTTVVTEWLNRIKSDHSSLTGGSEVKFSWITFDEADNDPIHFWRYIITAMQCIDPHLGESIQPVLYAPIQPPFRTLLGKLVNDILSVGIEFILVWDDYHYVENEFIHESVNLFIDNLPPLVHLVITTRSDPPLQLARRRARGELCELRGADLRFTQDEASHYIKKIINLELSAEDISILEARTEGWIAGLQMAAISMQGVEDPHTFVTAFRGDDRYIADYLMEEVLQLQPVDYQQFMLQTSVLDRLCASLCDAVTGRSDSKTLLNKLELANVFIVSLDNHREWFRYHQLFANLLQQRLLDTAGNQVVLDLKRRASQWHADHGNIIDAVDIAFSSGDYEQAASIIESSDQSLFMLAELNTLCHWSERIPTKIIAAHMRLNLMVAWANNATGHPQQAEQFVRLLEQTLGVSIIDFLDDSPLSQELLSLERSALLEASVILINIAVASLDLERTFTLGERVIAKLVDNHDGQFAFNPPENLLCPALFCLGLAHTINGNLAEATRLFSDAESEALKWKNAHIAALAMSYLGKVQAMQGLREQARNTYEHALETAKTYTIRSSAYWGLPSIGLGELELEQGDSKSAEAHFLAGVELGKLWNDWECLLPGMLGLARLHASRGEWQAAYSTLDDLLDRTANNASMVRPGVEAERAAIQLQNGDLAAAAQWASTFDTNHPTVHRIQWEQNALIAAQIWIAQGKNTEAKALLARLLSDARSGGRQQIVNRINQILIPTKQLRIQPPEDQALFEPPTKRELDVLRLMAKGLSIPEIARELYLSPNTLKAHAQNIYLKLDVHNRIEAVNKAKELNYL
jgi:ATP/maltotriose-dependent transcriptional regulator MalT